MFRFVFFVALNMIWRHGRNRWDGAAVSPWHWALGAATAAAAAAAAAAGSVGLCSRRLGWLL